MLMLGADSWLKLPDQVVIPILLYKEDMTQHPVTRCTYSTIHTHAVTYSYGIYMTLLSYSCTCV